MLICFILGLVMSEEKSFDVVVLGGGPGGYVAAIKAAQYTDKVALIEAGPMGGVCLNWGCIPTKTLIAHAHVLKKVLSAEKFGIKAENISVDYEAMKNRKDGVISEIRQSLEGLIKAHKVTIIKGFGKFISPEKIKVEGENSCIVSGSKIIIATGSDSRSIGAFPIDNKRILGAKSMLEQTTLPKKLVVVGGGVIGCEFANLYKQLGSEVVVLEAMDRLIPMESPQMSAFLQDHFKKIGIEVFVGVKVVKIDTTDTSITAHLENGQTFQADLCLMSVGIKLNTDNIGIEKAGVQLGKQGEVVVNERMETNIPGIYAIGDITAKMPLAHVASHQGIIAAQNACGKTAHMHYDAIPSVIYTDPEIATVGLSQEAAKEKGFDIQVGQFPFAALGKSKAAGDTEGFAQIVTDKKTGQILGAQVIGHEASTMIAEITTAMHGELTVEEIGDAVHAHPTLSEAWMEAALLAQNQPIHFPPQKK